jgi:PST family polysaccharide transporter
LGWEAAGYWEAMWRLSGAYLMLVSTTLSVYYLPRLSELKTGAEIRREILAGYRVILPVAAVCALLVYVLRHLIIETLFSAAFLPMESLFFWQLVGDVLKIASWLFAYVMLSKAMTLAYVITEISSTLIFIILTILFVKHFGLMGASVAHVVNYLSYLGLIIAVVTYKLHKEKSKDISKSK